MARLEDTENIEEFGRFQAARAAALIETDLAYDLSPGMIIASSGTAIVSEQIELETAQIKFMGSTASPAGDSIPDAEIREPTEVTSELQEVIDYARTHGLHEVADRLMILGERPFGDDEAPLQAASAMCFVEYCLARQKQARPLMTVTPAGELDATWKGPAEQSQVMRFFPNGSVWVAYKLLRGRGSFEAAAADVLDPDFHYKIPDWA